MTGIFTVAVLSEPGTAMTPSELATIQTTLAKMLDVPAKHVACRVVTRAAGTAAAAQGFPEIAAVLHQAPRLVVRMRPRPWDEWLIERRVPLVDWPPDPQLAAEAARSLAWMDPAFGGEIVRALGAAKEVVIVPPGNRFLAPEEGRLQIGIGLLSAFADPGPDFVVRTPVDVAVPVRSAETVVGFPIGSQYARSRRTLPFRLVLEDSGLNERVLRKSVSWITFVDGDTGDLDRCSSILFSPLRRVALASRTNQLFAMTSSVVAAAIRKTSPDADLPIRVRENGASLGVIQGHEAFERLNAEKVLGLKWELAEEEPNPERRARSLEVKVPSGDLQFQDAASDIAGWVAAVRRLDLARTRVRGNPEVEAAAATHGMDLEASADDLVRVRLAPLPLMPVA